MRTTITLMALSASVLLPALAANEDDTTAMTAGYLQQMCTAPDQASKSACRAYILGVTEGIKLGMGIADGKVHGGRPCVPENITASALELTVKMKVGADLTVFPEDRNLDAAGLVGGVMITTFPCNKVKR
jgi:hypothetical protein